MGWGKVVKPSAKNFSAKAKDFDQSKMPEKKKTWSPVSSYDRFSGVLEMKEKKSWSPVK
jgi:hypothetical protein